MWQKESQSKNALYINLCASNGTGKKLNEIYKDVRSEINVHKKMHLSKKCTATSVKKRKLANAIFHEREWEEAIQIYNESLCFAEQGSSCLGIAYANRSACFFNMNMYDKCMVDIELAKNNNCPKKFIASLDQRKEFCQKYMLNGWKPLQHSPQLSFPADEHFPDLAEAIQIERVKNKNHATMRAKQNIEVGQVIAIDKAFTKTSYTIYGWKCNICLKSNTNLVPCKKCTTAMFCHNCCANNNLHKFECGMKTSLYSCFNNYLMQELRTFFTVMNFFANENEMISFVEQCINSDPYEIPVALNDDRSKYRAFLKQANNSPDFNDAQFIPIVFCVYKILLEISEVNVMFATKKHRRFLMHLIGHHVQVNLLRSYTYMKICEDDNGEKYKKLYSQVGIMLNFFNHSSSPNVHPIVYDGDTVYIAVRPIEAGEELFISYYNFFGSLNTTTECRSKINATHNHTFERPNEVIAIQDDIIKLATDADFKCVVSSGIASLLEIDTIESDQFDMLIQKCVKILQNYGRMWSSELELVIMAYTKLVDAKLRDVVQNAPSCEHDNNNV